VYKANSIITIINLKNKTMKTKKISSAIAKAVGVLWIALLTGVIITYTTSCSSRSGQRHKQQQILKEQQVFKEQNSKYVGSEDYHELLEAITIIDDMNANEPDDFYTEMFDGIAQELNYILYEKISE